MPPLVGLDALPMRPLLETSRVLEMTFMNLAQITAILAVAVAGYAAFTDVKARRIPNRLTYPAALLGLGLQTALHGWRGLLLSAAGGLLFGGVFMLFHIVRAMGAGDVKLAAALGCMAGLAASPRLMFATALAGGVLAMIFIIASGRIVETLQNTLWVWHFMLSTDCRPTRR